MKRQNNEAKDRMETVNPQISVSTLNMNGLSSPVKKPRVAGWIKKKKKKTHLFVAHSKFILAPGKYVSSEWKGVIQER